jgi:HK97 family phage major capsid protein
MRALDEIRQDLDRARSKRDELKDDVDRIYATNGRKLDDGQAERVGNLVKGIEAANHEVESLEDELRDDLADGVRTGRYGTDPAWPDDDPRSQSRGNGDPRFRGVRDQALRANDRADFLPDGAKAHMERTIRDDDDPEQRLARAVEALADRDYFRAFSAWLNDPISGGHAWTQVEREAVQKVRFLERALGLGSQGGAFLVPYELDPQIVIANAGSVSPLRQIARVETTALNTKKVVTSLGVTTSWFTEASQATDDSPTLLQPSIDAKKAMAWVPVSFEVFEDSDIAQQIGKVFADSKAVAEGLAFTITQSNGPNGIISALVAAGGSTVIATGTNALSTADLYANQGALPARWRPNASWMANLSIINGYRQLPQATGLNYSIISDATTPPKALGWPVYENSNMDGALSGGANDYSLLSGDFSAFAIIDRIGTSVEMVPNVVGANQRPTGQRGFLMHWRTGSDVLIADAFRLSNFNT